MQAEEVNNERNSIIKVPHAQFRITDNWYTVRCIYNIYHIYINIARIFARERKREKSEMSRVCGRREAGGGRGWRVSRPGKITDFTNRGYVSRAREIVIQVLRRVYVTLELRRCKTQQSI